MIYLDELAEESELKANFDWIKKFKDYNRGKVKRTFPSIKLISDFMLEHGVELVADLPYERRTSKSILRGVEIQAGMKLLNTCFYLYHLEENLGGDLEPIISRNDLYFNDLLMWFKPIIRGEGWTLDLGSNLHHDSIEYDYIENLLYDYVMSVHEILENQEEELRKAFFNRYKKSMMNITHLSEPDNLYLPDVVMKQLEEVYELKNDIVCFYPIELKPVLSYEARRNAYAEQEIICIEAIYGVTYPKNLKLE